MPGDSNTYYPVAILKDTRTGAIIQQLNLTQDLLFTQRYNAVFDGIPDPGGLGRFFDITVYVYTDAGHTTLSQNYEIYNVTYRTFDILLTGSPQTNFAGSSNMGTNYRRIDEMFSKALAAKMLEVIAEVKGIIRSIPETKVDYDGISAETRGAAQSSAEQIMSALKDHFAGVGKMLETHKNDLLTAHSGSHEAMMQTLDGLARSIGSMGEDGKMSSGSMQSAIVEAIEKARDEMKKHHTTEHGDLGKKFDESSGSVHDSLKGMLTDKEIHLQLAVQPPAKEEKKNPKENLEEKSFSDDDMKTLLNL